jgi:2-polyprenyl-3-methyl-5-hydroxy-6-metoxy-1,4-benzoquinol methylase
VTASRDERTAAECFEGVYGRPPSEAARQLEMLVIGSDWGADGYTTLSQADLLADRLGLRAGTRLLDIGSGRGWPGLYLARTTGCSVVLADLPAGGLRVARVRARQEGLSDRCAFAVASARRLPFREESFDAIVHTDVLC